MFFICINFTAKYKIKDVSEADDMIELENSSDIKDISKAEETDKEEHISKVDQTGIDLDIKLKIWVKLETRLRLKTRVKVASIGKDEHNCKVVKLGTLVKVDVGKEVYVKDNGIVNAAVSSHDCKSLTDIA